MDFKSAKRSNGAIIDCVMRLEQPTNEIRSKVATHKLLKTLIITFLF